jgi:hypothetical protein
MSADTLLKDALYTLGNLISDVGLRRIGLRKIQRPFVWAYVQLRDQSGSIYLGHYKLAGGKA